MNCQLSLKLKSSSLLLSSSFENITFLSDCSNLLIYMQNIWQWKVLYNNCLQLLIYYKYVLLHNFTKWPTHSLPYLNNLNRLSRYLSSLVTLGLDCIWLWVDSLHKTIKNKNLKPLWLAWTTELWNPRELSR